MVIPDYHPTNNSTLLKSLPYYLHLKTIAKRIKDIKWEIKTHKLNKNKEHIAPNQPTNEKSNTKHYTYKQKIELLSRNKTSVVILYAPKGSIEFVDVSSFSRSSCNCRLGLPYFYDRPIGYISINSRSVFTCFHWVLWKQTINNLKLTFLRIKNLENETTPTYLVPGRNSYD